MTEKFIPDKADGLLSVARFRVPEAEGLAFAAQAEGVLAVLAGRPGFRGGNLARAVDDPGLWSMVTSWDGVGAYRRALSAYEVRVSAVPLLSLAVDEPGAYEVVAAVAGAPGGGAGARRDQLTDRAADAEVAGPGRAAAPEVPTTLDN